MKQSEPWRAAVELRESKARIRELEQSNRRLREVAAQEKRRAEAAEALAQTAWRVAAWHGAAPKP